VSLPEARFFRSPRDWRAWLEKNHDKAAEQWVGFHKVATGKATLTYAQALDEALCFGWIDGMRRGGDTTWSIRFTPRKVGSSWSVVKRTRMDTLIAEGRVSAPGMAVYRGRDRARQGEQRYSSRHRNAKFSPEYEKRFRANKKAWAWFEACPPSYRRPAISWVMSAKQEATRERRLMQLIEDSAAGLRVKPLRPPEKP
jgi:uncharacterized protein YdeI (YjbR/CyaY-like superfamily)